ncbi:endothelin-1-like [Arapaima gigas]
MQIRNNRAAQCLSALPTSPSPPAHAAAVPLSSLSSMDLTTFCFLTTTLALMQEQEADSATISGPVPVSERGTRVQTSPGSRRRAKRCSCENLKDIECVYFCHIGIVWVNTPGQVAAYGVGSPPVRRRRAAGRCVCTGDASCDPECLRFCSLEPRSTGRAAAQAVPPSEVERRNRSNVAAPNT